MWRSPLSALRSAGSALRRRLSPPEPKLLLGAPLGAIVAHQAAVAVRYRWGAPEELARLAALPDYEPRELPRARERLAAGDRFAVGELDGALVFAAWMMRGAIELGPRVAAIPRRYAYSYKVFTVEGARRKRVMLGYYAWLARALDGEGVAELLAEVKRRNRTSLRAHLGAGFRERGLVRPPRLPPWGRWRVVGPIAAELRE